MSVGERKGESGGKCKGQSGRMGGGESVGEIGGERKGESGGEKRVKKIRVDIRLGLEVWPKVRSESDDNKVNILWFYEMV